MTLANRLKTMLGNEDGIALVMTIQFMVVLAVAVGALAHFTMANSDHADYQKNTQVASTLAESGYNNAVSVLLNSSNPGSSSALPSSTSPGTDTTSQPGSTIKWWGSFNSATQTWTVTGRGEVQAPNSTATIQRTVSQRFRLGANGATVAGSPAWGYIFVDNKNGPCMELSNSTSIGEPLYVSGSVCMNNSAQILASASPVTVVGTINTLSTSKVGASTGRWASCTSAAAVARETAATSSIPARARRAST